MYKIALTQVIFDNSYNNVLRFSSLAEQKAYFNLDTLFSKSPTVNLPFGTFYMTRVPIRIDESKQNEALSYNYAIVKDLDQTDVYYFYFVKNASYDAGNTQMLCDLELDIFNTYYIDTTFTPCLVNRAHLDRWGQIDENSNVSFNNSENSLLFEQENITPKSKYLANRYDFNLLDNTFLHENDDTTLHEMLTHIKAWVYVYLDTNVRNAGWKEGDNELTYQNNKNLKYKENYSDIYYKTQFGKPYIVFCYPIVDDEISVYIHVKDGNNFGVKQKWDFPANIQTVDGIPHIFDIIRPYILDVVISPIIPFNTLELGTHYEIEKIDTEYTFTIKTPSTQYQQNLNGVYIEYTLTAYTNQTFKDCAVLVQNHIADNSYETPTTNKYISLYNVFNIQTKFSVSSIISSQHRLVLNPKLLMQPYCDLRLGISNSTPQNYDLFKLYNTLQNYQTMITIKWSGNLEPAINRIFIGAYGSDIYTTKSFKSFVGCKYMQDCSVPYNVDKLQEYLAQNKNFYLQRDVSISANLLQSVFSSFAQRTNVGKGVSVANGLTNAIETYVNSELTLDNMDNAPQTYKNLDGTPFVSFSINHNTPYLELWKCLPLELKIADADMNRNGYTYNQIDNVKNCDNIRHYWNFVQAQLENLTSTKIMSNNVREKFKEVFARGVRFWNITDLVTNNTFDFNTHENYERRLNNEL